ncbi:MAG: DUF4870 domain-containing protein [Planctomycetota bacterium]|nr:DUF4870 domain-containing protein [Planctomycetota bacterium]
MADSDNAPPTPGTPPSPGTPPAPAPSAPLTDDDRLWGLLAHVLALTGFVIPFGSVVGPAVAYFVRKDQSKFARFHAIQSFAFQVAVLVVVAFLAVFMILVSVVTARLGMLLFVPVYFLIGLGWLIYVIYMGLKANKGEFPKYPIVGEWAYKKVYEQDWKPV